MWQKSSRCTPNTTNREQNLSNGILIRELSAHNSFCFFFSFRFVLLAHTAHLAAPSFSRTKSEPKRGTENEKKEQTRSFGRPYSACAELSHSSMRRLAPIWAVVPMARRSRLTTDIRAIVIICPNIAQNLIKLRTFFIWCAWKMGKNWRRDEEEEERHRNRNNTKKYYHFRSLRSRSFTRMCDVSDVSGKWHFIFNCFFPFPFFHRCSSLPSFNIAWQNKLISLTCVQFLFLSAHTAMPSLRPTILDNEQE